MRLPHQLPPRTPALRRILRWLLPARRTATAAERQLARVIDFPTKKSWPPFHSNRSNQ